MAASSADRNTKKLGTGGLGSFPVYQDTTIYAGTLVCINSSGYAIPAANTAGNKLVGVAREQVVNTAAAGYGTSGDLNVEVERMGCFEFVSSGLTIANVGDAVYITDDQTVSTSAANVYAGVIAKYVSATSAYIDITPATRPAAYTSGALSLTGNLTLGANTTGYDLKCFGTTSGAYVIWDSSADKMIFEGADLQVNDSDELRFGDLAAGDITMNFDGTNFEIQGAAAATTVLYGADNHVLNTTWKGSLTVGKDTVGHDVKFFGTTSGKYAMWDSSADSLIVVGDAKASAYYAGTTAGADFAWGAVKALTVVKGIVTAASTSTPTGA